MEMKACSDKTQTKVMNTFQLYYWKVLKDMFISLENVMNLAFKKLKNIMLLI